MPKIHDYQPSFNAGEYSPRLVARTDFSKYKSGVATMENLLPLAEGGAMRRAGTRWMAEIKDSSVKGRLKPFEFSTTQAYALEMGDEFIRFYRNQAQIVVVNTDASIVNGTFPTDIASWTDKSVGGVAIAWNSGGQYMDLIAATGSDFAIAEQAPTLTTTSVEHVLKFRVVGLPGSSIKVRIGSATGLSDYLSDFDAQVGYHALAFTPTASPMFIQFDNQNVSTTFSVDDVSLIDNAPMEIQAPWFTSELFTVNGPQSNDVLYLFHGDVPPYKLERRGHTTWSLVRILWEDGPYLDLNDTTTTG